MVKSGSADIRRRHALWPVASTLIIIVVLAILTAFVVTRTSVSSTVMVDQSTQPVGGVSSTKSAEIVYLISRLTPSDPYGQETGRVRVVNLKTGEIVKTIETGGQPDVAVAPNGERLYMAALEKTGDVSEDTLAAFDTATWQVVWKTKIEGSSPTDWGRVVYIGNNGPSALVISPDGRQVLVYKYAGHDSWVTRIDTATGALLAESPRMSYCDTADLTSSPNGQWLYISCYGSNDVRFMNATTLQVEAVLAIPGAPFAEGPGVPPYTPIGGVPGLMVGSVLSADGHWLYVVTDEPRIALVDLERRSIESWVDLGRQGYPAVASGSVTLSKDGSRLSLGLRTKGADSEADEIRSFDTRSWKKIGQLRTGEGIVQLKAGQDANHLLSLLRTVQVDGQTLHTHTMFSIQDLAQSRAASPLNLGLSDNEEIVRFVIAP